MSVLRYFNKHHGWYDGKRTPFTGGGGSPPPPPAPTQTTVQNTNIPEYAQPYVETMLGAAQQQIFNYAPDSEGNMVPTSIKPYTPYSTNPQDYVAGFSPIQQQAQSNVANMQTPGQYGQATQAAGMGIMGSMGLAGQEAQTGRNLAQASTNPNVVGAYMNPYIQNTLAPSMQLLNQQYGMQGAAQQGAATQAGAFGGSRNALMQGLNQQNQMLAQNQLVGNAYNQAFQNAQNQLNTVSAQGLAGQQAAMQGLGQGIQGAGTLAGIGGQQAQTALGINAAQEAAGAAQQAQQQNIINQQIQNYATAQQYPMLQLANMSSLLRGLPMQSATTQTYQAAPSAVSQLGGLGATALGAYGAAGGFKGAKGGLPKDFEKVKKFDVGGAVKSQLYQLAETPEGLIQLQQEAKTSPSAEIRQEAAMILAEKQMEQQATQGVAGAPATNQMFTAAGGGIVAFDEGGTAIERRKAAESAVESALPEPTMPDDYKGTMTEYLSSPDVQKQIKERQIALDAVKRNNPVYAQNVIAPSATPTGSIFSNTPVSAAPSTTPAAPVTKTNQGVQFDPTAGGNPAVANLNKPGLGATPQAGGYNFPNSAEDKDYQMQVGKIGTQIDKLTEELNKGLKSGKSQSDLDDLREEIKDKNNQKLWLSLMAGGAKAMASTSPYAGVGLGQGIGAGVETYAQAKKDELADKKLLIAQQSALEQAEYARKTGNLNALIAAQTRLDQIKMHRDTLRAQYAQIGAGKEATIDAAKLKAHGDTVVKLMSQGMDEDQATSLADRLYSGKSAALPEGVKVTKLKG